ncbi:hypothetical protein FOMPIDRAFT_93518 [Fomitopsis schrenkii]|uniref:Uncharacterized protein n=1 Tax=Fomitopsis schrenkii TaxID=2126942 RepID=S8F7R4_FOMSC|nr:hypothetical protein FOMPIDRAFT_93518 [Fomitopsis schrenkii]
MPLQRSRIASATLPCIDPPGEKRKLQPPYNQPPFKRGTVTNELMARVSTMNPLPTLHRSLIPDLGAKWKPPVLYYGWSLGDRFQSLLDYAEAHKITRYFVDGRLRKPVAPNGDKLYDTDSEDSDMGSTYEDDEDEGPAEVIVDEQSSAQNALRAMAEEAGIRFSRVPYRRRPFELHCALHEPHHFVIVFYSNYELERAEDLSAQDVERMRSRLDIQEEAAWYVSAVQSSWSQVAPSWY